MSDSGSGNRPRSRGRVILTLVMVPLLLIAAVVIVTNIRGTRAAQGVAAELQRRQALQPAAPAVDPARDGSRHYRSAMTRATGLYDAVFSLMTSFDDRPAGSALDDATAAQFAAFAAQCNLLLLDLADANQYDAFDYQLDLHTPGSNDHVIFGEMRRLAQVLQALAVHEQAAGRPDVAMDHIAAMLRLTASFHHEHQPLAWMIRRSVDELAVTALADALLRVTPSAEAVQNLRAQVLANEAGLDVTVTLLAGLQQTADYLHNIRTHTAARAEQAYQWRQWRTQMGDVPEPLEMLMQMPADFRGMRRQQFLSLVCPGWLKLGAMDRVEFQLAMCDLAELPLPELAAALQALEPPTATGYAPSYEAVLHLRTYLAWRACLRVAAAALAVELHRLETGQWPDDASTFGEDWPSDPYDGRPLRLLRTADGVIVHSIGPHRIESIDLDTDCQRLTSRGLLIHLRDPADRSP